MTDSPNVAALRRVYEAMARGDFWAAGAVFDPEIEWEWADEMTGLVGGTVYRGIDGVEAATRDWLGAWEWFRQEAEQFVEAGEHVVVITRARGLPKGGTVEVEARNGQVWTMRDGRVVRFKQYNDPQDALRAVGAR